MSIRVASRDLARPPGAGRDGRTVVVKPGEHHVTSVPDETIMTVLGSCIAACVRDPAAGVGGLNHFMLPESATGSWGTASASLRYGNFAMERLINDILCRGGKRARLEIKLFGGARMFGNGVSIGQQNIEFIESYLRDEGLPVAARHLGGNHARQVRYTPLTGRALMLEMPRDDRSTVGVEASYRERLVREPAGGSVELFD